LQEHFGYGYDKAWNLNYRTNNALVETFNVHPVRYGATGSGWRPRGQPVTASRVGCMYLSHGVNNLNELATNTRSGTLTVAGTATEAGAYVTGVTVSGTGLSSGSANVYADGTWARSGAILANGTNTYTATAQDTYGRQDTGTVTVNLPLTNSFAYDLNGNLLSDGNRNFAHDDENELSSVWVTNVWRSDFLYDGMMRRRIRREYLWQSGTWALQSEIHYVYDGNLVVQERWFASSPAGLIAQDTITYTRGSDLSGTLQGAGGIGGLLARTDNGQLTAGLSSAHAYYHCDGNGNVTALVDTNGVILARYTYDAYGNIFSLSGPLATANLYRFSSKEWHPASGLVYYGYRFYDPNLQRWLNRDPIGEEGGGNLFCFVGNNALLRFDPSGEDFKNTCANLLSTLALAWKLLTGDPSVPVPQPPSAGRDKQEQLGKNAPKPQQPKNPGGGPNPEPTPTPPTPTPPVQRPSFWQRLPQLPLRLLTAPFIVNPIFDDPNYLNDYCGGMA